MSQDEASLGKLVASIRDYAIFMLDSTGHVRTWNEGARLIKGYEADEIIGSHAAESCAWAERNLRLDLRESQSASLRAGS